MAKQPSAGWQSLSVVDLRDLLDMKIKNMRPEDLDHLVQSRNDPDHARVIDWLLNPPPPLPPPDLPADLLDLE